MEHEPLLGLLDADREMIVAALQQDKSPKAAQATLEKALDRVALRYAEQCGDPASRDAAQLMLKAMKGALPLMDSVGEARRWQRTVTAPAKPRMSPVSMALLAVGAVLELAVMLGLLLTGGRLVGAVAFIEALVPALLGMAALFFAGKRYSLPEKKRDEEDNVRDEFLIDVDKVWHDLRGAFMLLDSAVEGVRAQSAVEKQRQRSTAQTALDPAQAELFSGILENGYAQSGADSREMVESVRFYLHGAGVEVVDYAPGREAQFEFLPAQKPGTIRPALVCGDKTIKKGLAAN